MVMGVIGSHSNLYWVENDKRKGEVGILVEELCETVLLLCVKTEMEMLMKMFFINSFCYSAIPLS